MSNPISVLPAGVANATAVPAASKVPGAARAQTATGPVTVQTDVMQFPAPHNVGNWILGSFRVKAGGVPVIHQASAGTSVSQTLPLPPGPMTVTLGDARVKAM